MAGRPAIFNIDKPGGMTSRSVVDRVVRRVGDRRAGHAGTLDPLATGVLVVAVGPATRLVEYIQRYSKTYVAEILLDRFSDTDDVEGEMAPVQVAQPPERSEVEATLERFRGEILQRPPKYSALKVEGKRAYRLARQGKEVELAPRPVRIDALEVIEYDFPRLVLRIDCGGGTYIRSLARDLGAAMGTGGVLAALRRTAIGPYRALTATTLDRLLSEDWQDAVLPVESAVGGLPRHDADAEGSERFLAGKLVATNGSIRPGLEVAVFDPQGRLLGIAEALPGGALQPRKGGFARE